MRDTFLRSITDLERNTLYDMIEWNDKDSNYRAKIILLRDKGYTVPEIRMATNHHHDIDIRKWIHRFNEKGIEGITSKIHAHKSIRIDTEMEIKIVEIATKDPRKDYELPFSTWSLRVLTGYVSKKLNLVNSISHTEIRNILLLKYGIKYRRSKISLGVSTDPEYHLKKRELKS